MKKYIQTFANYAIAGGIGTLLAAGLAGCEHKESSSNAFSEAQKKEGAFVVVQEMANGSYKIVEEYPSSTTRVILRDLNGSERILSKEELQELVKKEKAKIDANQSPLVNPQIHSQMSLAETILASAAGAIIGSWIGSKLFNNPTYQQRRMQSYKTPAVYQRSQTAFKTKQSSTKKSGFFSTQKSKKSFFSFGG